MRRRRPRENNTMPQKLKNMSIKVLYASIACALLIAAAPRARAQTPLGGPIPLRDPDPFHLLFLQFEPQGADLLPSGGSEYRLQLDLINNLLVPAPLRASVHIDNEYQRLSITWRHGLGHGSELQIMSALLWRNAGILDGIITFWHHLFGIPANAIDDPLGRDHWPQYQSVLAVSGQNGAGYSFSNGFGLSDTLITYKHALIRPSHRSALALRLALKLPTGNPALFLGSGNADIGADLDARYSIGRDINIYINLAEALLGHASHAPGAQPHMQQGLLALEYHPNSRDRYILQTDYNSLAVRTGNAFADQAAVTATFGFTHLINARTALYASYSENGDIHNYTLPAFSNIGPDISFSFGAVWKS